MYRSVLLHYSTFAKLNSKHIFQVYLRKTNVLVLFSQVNLDESQTAEQEEVRATLHKEQELLQAYQRRLHHRLQESMSKESELFVEESQKKLAVLQDELLEVDRQFARARTEAESKVRARQRKELTDFQNQSHELPPSESFMNRTWGRRSSPFAGFSKF